VVTAVDDKPVISGYLQGLLVVLAVGFVMGLLVGWVVWG
jgi:hypothetical protein